jgi:2-polyprenyl-6-methoxyphenol hydroxylase-like FAD-dependent oxidoreductase
MDAVFDVAIVGGSVAGSALAIDLRQRGHSVVVLEAQRFPREKLCGEGVMPSGVDALKALGLMSRLQQGGAQPMVGISWHVGDASASATFPGGREGLCVRRWVLDEALSTASRLAGAVRLEGAALRSLRREGDCWQLVADQAVQARVVVGADGARSFVRRALRIKTHHGRPATHRFGIRRHFRFAAPTGETFVQVHFLRGAEIYVTPSGPDCLNVTLLLHRQCSESLKGKLTAGYMELIARVPELWRRLGTAEPINEARACGPLRVRPDSVVADHALLMGDAAGYVDAITGEGVSLALRTSAAAAEVLSRGLLCGRTAAADLAPYARARHRAVRDHEVFTEGVLLLARHHALVRAAVGALGRRQDLFGRLLGANDQAVPLWRTVVGCAPGLARALVPSSVAWFNQD